MIKNKKQPFWRKYRKSYTRVGLEPTAAPDLQKVEYNVRRAYPLGHWRYKLVETFTCFIEGIVCSDGPIAWRVRVQSDLTQFSFHLVDIYKVTVAPSSSLACCKILWHLRPFEGRRPESMQLTQGECEKITLLQLPFFTQT